MTAESDNPSLRDERSTAPYNEDKVSSPEMLLRLKKDHPDFRGDWSHLERLVRNLDTDKTRGDLKPEDRLKDWNDWVSSSIVRSESIHLEGVRLSRAHLEWANLRKTHLEQASLQEAHLEGAYLQLAHIEGAQMWRARLEGAHMWKTHLEWADIREAVLDKADLRHVTGMRFDENSVFRIRIEGNAPDPWSVLRRKYTGPWFFCHLLLLIAFFAPYVGRVLALSALSHGQTWLEVKSDEIVKTLDEHSPPAGAAAEAALSKARGEFNERFRQAPAVWVVIGGTRGWWALAFAFVVIVYNVLRLVLTLRVGMLRDAEERSAITPRLEEYDGPTIFQRFSLWQLHRAARILWAFAIASVAINTLVWVFTTTVPVPR